ncbi:MAG: tetratricopeptide repeat protein [Bacteroidota bacterium]|nr:tetratricopeptide repeat protein [Bacteroidota bacterium]
MNMRLLLIALSALLIFPSCSRESDKELWRQGKSAYDGKRVDESIRFFQRLVDEFPQSPLVPDALYRLGSIYQTDRNDPRRAAEYYEQIHRLHPESPFASKGLFLGGFLYANALGDTQRARTLYETYLRHYADVDSNITRSIHMELKTLGKSPEEALREVRGETLIQGRKTR